MRPYKPIKYVEYFIFMGMAILMLIGLIVLPVFLHPSRPANCTQYQKQYKAYMGSYMLDVFSSTYKSDPERIRAYRIVTDHPACFPAGLVFQAKK